MGETMNSIGYARQKMLESKQLDELNYEGNIGLMEVSQFYVKAKKNNDHSLIKKVEDLISSKNNAKAWKIILDYLGVSLSPIK